MSTFIRRDLFEEAGPLDIVDRISFDYEYWLRLGALAEPLILDERLAVYRYHYDSVTGQNLKVQFTRELDHARRYARAHGYRWPIWLHHVNYWKTLLFYDLVKRF